MLCVCPLATLAAVAYICIMHLVGWGWMGVWGHTLGDRRATGFGGCAWPTQAAVSAWSFHLDQWMVWESLGSWDCLFVLCPNTPACMHAPRASSQLLPKLLRRLWPVNLHRVLWGPTCIPYACKALCPG